MQNTLPTSTLSAKGRIALFFLYDTLEPFTFVRDALCMLVERGYTVDIYAAMSSGQRSTSLPDGISILPHPEAFVHYTQHPRWTRETLEAEGDGLRLFRNAYKYILDHEIGGF